MLILPCKASPDDTQSNHISSMKSETTASMKAKLRKLTLKKFKRDISKWSPFWDSYSSSIHDNPDLNKMDKFNYLTSLLLSSVAEAISGLKVTAANYNEALEVLKQRFGNKQQIAISQMDGQITCSYKS